MCELLTDCENRAKAEGEVVDTLRSVAMVRAANTPGGEVSVFTLGKLVALTKARRMIPEGSWQAKVIDERAVDLARARALAGLGFGARGPALVVRGPATAYRAQGDRVLELTTTDAGPSGEDVNVLAAEILARAPAPTL